MKPEEFRTMMLRFAYCLLLVWSVAGLFKCTVHDLVKPDPVVNETLTAEEACAGLCDVMVSNECEGWRGSPGRDERFGTDDDVRCEDQCIESVSMAEWLLEKARCGAAAMDCEGIDACMKRNP